MIGKSLAYAIPLENPKPILRPVNDPGPTYCYCINIINVIFILLRMLVRPGSSSACFRLASFSSILNTSLL